MNGVMIKLKKINMEIKSISDYWPENYKNRIYIEKIGMLFKDPGMQIA